MPERPPVPLGITSTDDARQRFDAVRARLGEDSAAWTRSMAALSEAARDINDPLGLPELAKPALETPAAHMADLAFLRDEGRAPSFRTYPPTPHGDEAVFPMTPGTGVTYVYEAIAGLTSYGDAARLLHGFADRLDQRTPDALGLAIGDLGAKLNEAGVGPAARGRILNSLIALDGEHENLTATLRGVVPTLVAPATRPDPSSERSSSERSSQAPRAAPEGPTPGL